MHHPLHSLLAAALTAAATLAMAQTPAPAPTPATAATSAPADPYLWLEDVTGERALAWVRERNADSRALLAAQPGFEANRKRFQEILDSKQSIPTATHQGGWLYNFWRDEQHPRGLHPVTFRHCAAYPSVEESKRLTWGNLWFFRWNVTLALVLGFLVYVPLLLIGYSVLHVQEPGKGLLASPSPRSLLLTGILWFVYSLILGSGCARFAAGTATGEREDA